MRFRHLAAVVTLAVFLAACSGDSTPDDTAATTTTQAIPSTSAPVTTTGAVAPATPLVAFSDHLFGATGLAPEGWTEIQYGVLLREAIEEPALLVMQASPGITATDLLRGLRSELALDDRPEPVGNVETDYLSWTLYSFDTAIAPLGLQELRVDAAIADSDFGGFVVAVGALPDESEALVEEVFRPAVAAYAPPQQLDLPPAAAAYRDAAAPIESRVEDLLSRMTLGEKIGQMTQVEKNSIFPEDIRVLGIGSLLSGGGAAPDENTPEAWAAMVDGYQASAMESRLRIPLLYGVDAVHGHNNVRGATVFPHNVGLGAANDPDLMRRIGEITASEVAATGIPWNFAPTVAVPQDIRWGRTYEGYGEDPDLVSRLAAAYMEGLQGSDLSDRATVMATPKHFIGDGGTTWGSATTGSQLIDQGVTEVDEATLRAVHLPPYIAAIDSGARSVMVSYSSWNETRMHAERYLITDVLKGELGFDGLVLSDWQAIDQISADYSEAVAAAFNAGIDMNMVPYDYRRFIWTLWRAVDNGDVAMERIDDAVRRILRVKFELGLFEAPLSDPALLADVGSPEHRAVAREAAAKTAVLLKNEGDLLPLGDDAGVIFVGGQAADDVGIQSGGWTIEWQGKAGAITPGTSILEGIRASAGEDADVYYDRFGNLDRVEGDRAPIEPDVCIGVVGERPYAEFQGDSADLAMASRDIPVLESMKGRCDRLVIVLISGRPLIVTDHLEDWDALVAAWLPGTEGQGIADVLFGDVPFGGRLAYTWPASIDQVPLGELRAQSGEPLFPLGFGLEA